MNDMANVIVEAISEYSMLQIKEPTLGTFLIPLE
jgi:hypothetical protein